MSSLSVKLEFTRDLFIIRLNRDKIAKDREVKDSAREILNSLEGAKERQLILLDSYPEADVTVWRVLGPRPRKIRKEVLEEIRANNDPRVIFAGRIKQRSDTGVYQIYTGNLFICLHEDYTNRIEEICEQYQLRLKRERVAKLGFNSGAFFVETTNGAHHVFEVAERLLTELQGIVTVADPELIIKRKTFKPKEENTYTADGILDPQHKITETGLTALGLTSDRPKNNSWIERRTRIAEAHKFTKGKDISIAIIDDGIEANHPAFQTQNHQVISRDFLGAKETDPADHQYREEKHGTACASIAVSSDNLAPGVAPEARLIVARTKGLGSILEAEAISWAVEKGAKIISCSWGPADGDPGNPDITPARHPLPTATRLALKDAAKRGCLVVFAAGNGNEPLSPDEYANNPYVIAVGSSNKKDRRSSYSDYGPELFCCFPSSDIRVVGSERISVSGNSTADRLGELGYTSGDYFHCFGGTSAAAPAVAGIAALVLSITPNLTLRQLKHVLRVSCTIPGHPPGTRNDELGYGIIDALTAVQLARKLTGKEVPEEFMAPFSRLLTLSPQLKHYHSFSLKTNAKMSNKAVSLHIGVNNVDPKAYPEYTVPPLAGCINDAEKWEEYAQEVGYEDRILFTDSTATRKRILNKLSTYAKTLKAGDICLLTYAGHGSQIPLEENDPDESDNYDETWLLYDGILLDDEIDAAAAKFKPGVRLVIISDSCHSGTVSRNLILAKPRAKGRSTGEDLRERKVDSAVARSNYNASKEKYRRLKAEARNRPATKAFVKLLPGCQDQQTSKERNGEGVFTAAMLKVLRANPKGEQKFNYETLMGKVRALVYMDDQLPTVYDSGHRDAAFDAQYPLDIAAPAGLTEAVEEEDFDKSSSSIGKAKDSHISAKDSDDSSLQEPESQEIELLIGTNKSEIFNHQYTGTLSQEDRLAGASRAVQSRELTVPYDHAYALLAANPDANIDYVEIDQSSEVGVSPQVDKRGTTKKRSTKNELGFMEEYPYPPTDHPDSIIWHLGDAFTQLRRAALLLHPEISHGTIPTWNSSIPTVAMIDTGLRYDYPTLPQSIDVEAARSFSRKGKTIKGEQAQDRGLMPEKHGHGTATANLLAGGYLPAQFAPGNQWNGIIGAAPQVKVVPLRISESVVILNPKAFASALRYAINIGTDVVSMSMAGAPSNRMAAAVNEAYLQGVVVVSAGGNQWSKGAMGALPDAQMYPARFDRVISAVGVAFDGKPYRANRNTSDVLARSEGGNTMGSCYGPRSTSKTTIAAYTPNTLWAGGDGKKEGKMMATMNGGGTSTATPQIAAAAAMWLEFHGAALDKAITAFAKTPEGKAQADKKYGHKWIRAEAVRQALFRAAKPEVGIEDDGTHYDHLYGQGVLQAFEALRYRPISKIGKFDEAPSRQIDDGYLELNIDTFKRANEAEVRLFGLVESAGLLMSAYRAFGKRSRSAADATESKLPNPQEFEALERTLAAEMYSLLYGIDELRKYRGQTFINGKFNPELAAALLTYEDKISETLRMVLSPYAVSKGDSSKRETLSRGSEVEIPQIFALPASNNQRSNASKIVVVAEQAGIDVSNQKNPSYGDANNLLYEEFAIEVNTEQLRKQGTPEPLNVVIRPAKTTVEEERLEFGGLAALIERRDENDNLIDFEWRYDGDKIVGTRGLAPRSPSDSGPGLAFRVSLVYPAAEGDRGVGRFVKKIVGRVFKLFVKNKEGKLGKEVHRSYQLRHINPSAKTLTGKLGKAHDITNSVLPNLSNLADKDRSLVLIHGMYATVESSFGEMLGKDNTLSAKIAAQYGNRVYGFEHPSVVESIDDNFKILEILKDLCKDKPVDIVATSRGTHLARRMRLSGGLFDVDRAMYVGGTTFGTDIAREDKTLALLKRVTGMFAYTSKLAGPQVAGIVKVLEKIVNKVGQSIISLPGITDQIPNSTVVTEIAHAYKESVGFDNESDLWVGANWQPDSTTKRLAKMIDRVGDSQIFGFKASDGVAPLDGALGRRPGDGLNGRGKRLELNPTNTYHFTYFDNKHVRDAFLDHFA